MSKFVDAIEVVEETVSISPTGGSSQLVTLTAPSGKKVVGGGAYTASDYLNVRYSYPSDDGLSWNFDVLNGQTQAYDLVCRIMCLG